MRQGHYLTHAHSRTPYSRGGCKAVYQAPALHNTCRSFWLGTAQQFYNDMGGEGGSRVKILRTFPAKASPLGASSTQHMWELLAGNRTAVLHDMRGEGGSWVWCMCAPYFNLSFENNELNCSLHKEFEMTTLQRKCFEILKVVFCPKLPTCQFWVKFSGLICKLKIP